MFDDHLFDDCYLLDPKEQLKSVMFGKIIRQFEHNFGVHHNPKLALKFLCYQSVKHFNSYLKIKVPQNKKEFLSQANYKSSIQLIPVANVENNKGTTITGIHTDGSRLLTLLSFELMPPNVER